MLKIYQKSAYLLILNATMILRSIGSTFKVNKSKITLKEFKVSVFKEIDRLTTRMDAGTLTEKVLLSSIVRLAKKCRISIGQSQKAINVILKFHFHLSDKYDNTVKKSLHCPIDSKTLLQLNEKSVRLNKIDIKTYLKLQAKISDLVTYRIDYDIHWDKQHLSEEGLL